MKIQRDPLRNQRSREGFSLAELMVVIVIIGLLATLVVPNVMKSLGSANIGKAKADINSIWQALDNYAIEHGGRYPDTLDQLIEKDESGRAYLDLDRLPIDPWKNEYQYNPPSGGLPPELFSLGSDGEQGGEGDGRDITYRMIKNHEI